ncbi:MAG: hypothetical protein JXB07_10220 [Anaerolineae bacterium]|nr:hypothetical protein [Anaerolineae bacterium]
METKYRHTQYGALMFIVFLITGILIAVVALKILAEDRVPSAILMLGVYLLGLLMFYSLTVEISEEKLKFWFGIGIIQKTIALSEIQSTKEVENPWYYFWGIKVIPGGWFYAIAPGIAVEIELRDGRIIQLGTNQPKQLNQAIEQKSKPNPASTVRG